MRVLVGIDGSDHSRQAVLALNVFAPIEQTILLHTFSVPQLAYPGTGMSIGHDFTKKAEQALRGEGVRFLNEMATIHSHESGALDKRLEAGDPAAMILSIAEHEKVDFIVLGSRGLGTIREHMLGSVSHRVTTHAVCPTLIVKSSIWPFKHILLPIEHQHDADQALAFLEKNPFREKVHITALHVVPFAQPALPVGALIPESWRKDLIAGAENFVSEVSRRLSSLGYETASVVTAGAPSRVIHEQALSINPDLIIMGAQSHRGLGRFLQGSVSHAVIHHASCSIFLVR